MKHKLSFSEIDAYRELAAAARKLRRIQQKALLLKMKSAADAPDRAQGKAVRDDR
jgi:hypothetical protein